MVREICLDSDVIIEFLKGNFELREKMRNTEALWCATPINIFEVWYGKEKQEGTREFIELVVVKEITKEIGVRAAEMMSMLRKDGLLVEFRDVMIASACIEYSMPLLTNNKKHFERLQKFGLRIV